MKIGGEGVKNIVKICDIIYEWPIIMKQMEIVLAYKYVTYEKEYNQFCLNLSYKMSTKL